MKKTRALIPGSFDPVTRGHESVIQRAALCYDEVHVIVFINPDKPGLLSHEARVALLRLALAKYPNVKVGFDGGMVADYVRREGIDVIVKGIRDERDLAYETPMAEYNLRYGGVETVFLTALSGEEEISSSAVRTALARGEDISRLVPSEILDKIFVFLSNSRNND